MFVLLDQRCYKLKNQKPTQTASPIWTSPSPSSQSETTPMVTKEDLRYLWQSVSENINGFTCNTLTQVP